MPEKFYAVEMVGRHENGLGTTKIKSQSNRGRGGRGETVLLEDLIINLGGILSPRSTCLLVVKVLILLEQFAEVQQQN